MSNLSLYSIGNELAALLDTGIDEDGVISPELEAAMVQFEAKAKAVVAYVLTQEARLDMGKQAIKQASEHLKAEERRIERLREYLAANMKRTETSSIEADNKLFAANLYIDRDEAVEVFQPELVPLTYLREIPARFEPDKRLIKEALAKGKDVPGAVIVKKDRLQIR